MKLADFGSANFQSKVRRETVCGTPEYLAPEMVLKKGHDHKADVWGFGALLFELLEGKTPFAVEGAPGRESQDALFQRLMQNILVRPAHQHADVKMLKTRSPEATDLVLRCLNRSPEKRWDAASLLRHPFFARHSPAGSLLLSSADRGTLRFSSLNVVLSSKVHQKVLPEDDSDFEDIFKSNTAHYVSPSSLHSSPVSPVLKSEECAKMTAKTHDSTHDSDAPMPEVLAATIRLPGHLGPQQPAGTNPQLAQSQQELKLEGELDAGDSSAPARRLELFPYARLTQLEASAG